MTGSDHGIDEQESKTPALAVCGWPGFGLSGCDLVYSSDVVPSVGAFGYIVAVDAERHLP